LAGGRGGYPASCSVPSAGGLLAQAAQGVMLLWGSSAASPWARTSP